MFDEPAIDEGQPRSAPPGGLRHTWGLGAIAVYLLGLVGVSGLVLLFFYRPVAPLAWADLADLHELSFFAAVPTMHRWAAHALIVVVGLHLFRAFADGSYRGPRRRDWTLGTALLVLCLALFVTGLPLPWSQQAEAEATAAAQILTAQPQPPPLPGSALFKLYVLHALVLPLLLAAGVVYHLRRARRGVSGNVERPEA